MHTRHGRNVAGCYCLRFIAYLAIRVAVRATRDHVAGPFENSPCSNDAGVGDVVVVAVVVLLLVVVLVVVVR